jgi:Na+-transporting NADH:ubiquinone oxidoreductase subunit C
MRIDSPAYTLAFAAGVCVVCSLFVASATVLLKDMQDAAKLMYIQKNVLLEVTGLVPIGGGAEVDRDELFRTRIRARFVDLESGEYVEKPGVDPLRYDQRAARNDPARSREAPANDAQVRRVPNRAVIYQVLENDEPVQVVLPIEGRGLYSMIYGFIALDRDGRTVRGLSFYEQGETPGLGDEINNPMWKALWPGRKAFDENWQVRLAVKKGAAGPPEQDPYQVDGLSGATVTSDAVTHMIAFWLGEHGFGKYLARAREKGM